MSEPIDFAAMILNYERTEEPAQREKYVRAPFNWPGGKFDSLHKIIPLLPKGKRFIDVCGGSGVVTLNLKHDYELRVFNDRHAGLVAFYRCIRDPVKKERLLTWLENTIHSREDFIWCRDSWENCQDDVERGARWYFMVRTSFAGLGRNWGRSTLAPGQTDKALKNGLGLFPMLHRGFAGVQVENLDAVQCVKDYSHPDSVYYIDPDYIDTDSGIYKHGVEHKPLLDTVFQSKGWFAVSSYRNSLYDSYNWTERYEWDVTSTMRPQGCAESNNLKDKANVMTRADGGATEVLYVVDRR